MATLLGILALMAAAVTIIGWLWITVMAFSEGETLWGIGCLIISPLCFIYGFLNYQEAKIPLIMLCAGFGSRIAIAVLVGVLG